MQMFLSLHCANVDLEQITLQHIKVWKLLTLKYNFLGPLAFYASAWKEELQF